jgi:hypothetical protein
MFKIPPGGIRKFLNAIEWYSHISNATKWNTYFKYPTQFEIV